MGIFKDIADAGLLALTVKPKQWGECRYSIVGRRYEWETREVDDGKSTTITHIGIEIETGGASGGSCWGSEAQSYRSNERLDEDSIILGLHTLGLIDLDAMTVRAYLRMKTALVTSSRSENEYYGNCTEYECRAIPVKVVDGKLGLDVNLVGDSHE